MILVADASFAAKVLLAEAGTEVAQRWWGDESATWLAPTLIGPEVEAAVAVHHRNHPDTFDERRRKLASTTWAAMLDAIVLRTMDRALADTAARLIQDHGPLRGADACYLATAEHMARESGGDVVLGSFDRQQRRAAWNAGVALTPKDEADG